MWAVVVRRNGFVVAVKVGLSRFLSPMRLQPVW